MISYIPGVFLILTGCVILAFPQLLIAAIATLFLLAGFTALGLAHRTRRMHKNGSEFRAQGKFLFFD